VALDLHEILRRNAGTISGLDPLLLLAVRFGLCLSLDAVYQDKMQEAF
jgi:hypothetical protein